MEVEEGEEERWHCSSAEALGGEKETTAPAAAAMAASDSFNKNEGEKVGGIRRRWQPLQPQ